METNELGTTGIEASTLGLGAGGSSRLGLEQGASDAKALELIETGLELGVTFIDTAEGYNNEHVIGEAIERHGRDTFQISTKFSLWADGESRTSEDLEPALDASLDRLQSEYVDVYHLHGVNYTDYESAVERFVPELNRLKAEGKIRAIGITEATANDPEHKMLSQAVTDDHWDAVMVGHNLLNHSARDRVLEPAAERGIGTIGMVAVRRALSDQQRLRETIEELIESGEVDPNLVDPDSPFDFLLHEDGADDIFDAAYRFCRHEPHLDTVLTGTGSIAHLTKNAASAMAGPLPEGDLETLAERFGNVDSVIGN